MISVAQSPHNKREASKVAELDHSLVDAYVEFINQLTEETNFLEISNSDLSRSTHAETRNGIHQWLDSPWIKLMVSVNDNNQVCGFVLIQIGMYDKTKHVASLTLGVLQEYHRQGVGNSLITAAEHWARTNGVRRIELTVNVDNKPALRLYQSFGFSIEGKRQDSLQISGKMQDEYYMAKFV